MTAVPAIQRQTSILLVDDHRVFADVLAMRLRAEPAVTAVEVAYSLSEARSAVTRFQMDVVLLDYQLAEDCGLDLLDDIDRLSDRPDVLMLSGLTDADRIVDALAAGVQGWVTKDATFEHLVVATGEVLQGHMYLSPPTVKPVVQQLLNEARGPRGEPSFLDDLSRRELEVLRCLVSGMSRSEVAAYLYLSVNTVRTHVQHLLHHAGVHSTLALVALARDLGVPGIHEQRLPRVPRQRRSPPE
jgi:DNA-binding NarL/FixJ family response regulator